jgi:hypothetical protein
MGEDRPRCAAHPNAGAVLKSNWQMVCPRCETVLWIAKPPGLLERPTCATCEGQATVRLFRVVAANGHDHVVWYCKACERYVKDGNRLWLPARMVEEFLAYWNTRLPESNLPKSISTLPLLKEHTGGDPCAICGATATEYNHYMPQAFKDDPDIFADWPEWDRQGAWLCDRHHRLWHAKVAPLQALAQAKREAVRG